MNPQHIPSGDGITHHDHGHAANRRIYGQWMSSIPSRFIAEIPPEHVDSETSFGGGASLWRANWSTQGDPFAHVAERSPARAMPRGPAWQRAAAKRSEEHTSEIQSLMRITHPAFCLK